MISAARTTKRNPGFTLIEIILVLAIAAVVMGSSIGMMIYSSDKRSLTNASGEIELMAKRARTIAILHQTPYALEFREGVVRLMPFAQAGADEKKTSRSSSAATTPENANTQENRQFTLEGGLNLFIRRWNSEQWLATTKRAVHVWRFDPDGLCEPISIRLTLGESSSEDTFHPLTATSILEEQKLETR